MKQVYFTFRDTRYSLASAGELMAFLEVLDPDDDRLLLEAIGSQICEILTRPIHLKETFRMLDPGNQIILIKLLGDNLLSILNDSACLSELLSITSDKDVEITLFKTLGTDGMRALIRTPLQAAGILEWIYGECDTVFTEIIGIEYLKEISRSGQTLAHILESMHPSMRKRFIEETGIDYLHSIIHTPADLGYLMRALPSEISIILIEKAGSEFLKQLIRNMDELKSISGFLERKEHELLLQKLEGYAN